MDVIASTSDIITGLLVAAFLIGAAITGAYYFLRWLRDHGVGFGPWGLSEDEKARRSELRAYNHEVKAIERDHTRRLRDARAELKRAEKTQNKRVSSLEKQLQRARTPEKLDGFWSTNGWARLFEDRVETSKGTIRLSPSVLADINTSGNLAIGGRSTLTRMGTGALIAGPLGFMVGMAAKKDRKVDTRELYLIVQDDSGGGIVVPCNPDQGAKVRQFALNLMAAARRAPEAAAARRALIEEAERALRTGRSDTGNVESAQSALETVETEQLALPPAPESASEWPLTTTQGPPSTLEEPADELAVALHVVDKPADPGRSDREETPIRRNAPWDRGLDGRRLPFPPPASE